MKGYKKSIVRVGSVMPDDRIMIGGELYRIREYKQLDFTRSTQLILVRNDGLNPQNSVILSMTNDATLQIYNQK